jgi:hypothetical protein
MAIMKQTKEYNSVDAMLEIKQNLHNDIWALYANGMTLDNLKHHAFYFLFETYGELFSEEAFMRAVDGAFPFSERHS